MAGNEKADELAKLATTQRPRHLPDIYTLPQASSKSDGERMEGVVRRVNSRGRARALRIEHEDN